MEHSTLKQAACDALAVQDASNISGVVHAFSRAMRAVYEDSNHETAKIRAHPIVLLFMDKLKSMTLRNPDLAEMSHAFDACGRMMRAEGPEVVVPSEDVLD